MGQRKKAVGPKRGPQPGKATKASRKGKALVDALTPAHELFIQRWMVRRNNTQAYRESHPAASNATCYTEGSKLLRDPRIASRIKQLLADEAKRVNVTVGSVTDNLAALAFSCLSDVIGADGRTMALQDMPRGVAMAVKKVKRVELFGPDGEDGGKGKVIGHTVEIEMHDKVRPLHLLGMQVGMFVEKVEHTLAADLLDAMAKARERVRLRSQGQVIEHEPLALPEKAA